MILVATFALIINGVDVLAHSPTGGAVSLVSFERNHDDPAELVVRVAGDWRRSPWACDTPATLLRDGAIVFEGLVYLPRPVASERDYPAVEVPIHDRAHALRFVSPDNDDGFPDILLDGGALSAVWDQLLSIGTFAELLEAKGVSTMPEFVGGAGEIQCLPVTLASESVDGAVRKIAAAAPGVRAMLAPPLSMGEPPRYRFVNLFGAPAVDLVIDAERVNALSLQPSIEGRAGAVRVLGGRTIGEVDVGEAEDVALLPNWNPADEPGWAYTDAFAKDADGAPLDTALTRVFRAYYWEGENDIPDEMIEAAMVQIDAEPPGTWVRAPVERIDHENKTVWLKKPAIAMRMRRNRLAYRYYQHRGRSVGLAAKLRVRTGGTGAAPIYIATHRVPETGFAGRAYDIAPLRCANVVTVNVPGGTDRAAYAAQAHAALSEPIVSGDVPLDGDAPAALWGLSRRLNLRTASHGETGLENMLAPLLGLHVTFEPAIRATLSFNRDDSVLLSEGAQ